VDDKVGRTESSVRGPSRPHLVSAQRFPGDLLALDCSSSGRLTNDVSEVGTEPHRAHRREVRSTSIATGVSFYREAARLYPLPGAP
jgi:hypothetical protein